MVARTGLSGDTSSIVSQQTVNNPSGSLTVNSISGQNSGHALPVWAIVIISLLGLLLICLLAGGGTTQQLILIFNDSDQ